MWLTIRVTFNDDRDKFYKGELRFVEDKGRAIKFIEHGWAEDSSKPGESGAVSEGSVDLTIQSGTLGMRDTRNG